MNVAFGQPEALLLLLTLPVFYVVGRWGLRNLPADVRRTAITLRLLVVTLLVIALARPLVGQVSQSLSVVFAIDVSLSVSPEARATAQRFIQEATALMRPDDRAGTIGFGGEAVLIQPLGGRRGDGATGPSSGTAGDAPPNAEGPALDQTNIEKAIHLARSIFPARGGKRIVLLTDGNENAGAAEREAREAGLKGNTQIDVVPLASADRPEVLVEGLDLPPALRVGEQAELGVTVRSTVETDGRLGILMDDRPMQVGQVRLRPGANRFTIALPPLDKGFHSYRAHIDASPDTFPQNNEASAFTVVKDAGKVLAIVNNSEDFAALQRTLESAGVQVEVQPPSFIPSRITPMKSYESTLLVNVPAQSLTLDQMKTLVAYVQSLGRGLVVIGGDNSFSVGNYGGTPLADILPVQMNVPGKIERGNIALLLIIDKSGSMDSREQGVTKMEMARKAAILASDVLDPNDQLGVTAFDTDNQWVVPIQRVGDRDNLNRIQERVSRIEASGGTEIYKALGIGYEAIVNSRARYKHIILLSDGRSLTNSDYSELINRMRAAKVTLSTIAIGSDADLDLMQELARQGDGRYYFTENPRDIPQITTRETRIASGAAAVEGAFQPKVVAPSPILKSIAEAQVPQLHGYVVTSPRDTANVVVTSDRSDPILAHWNYGLGRVVIFTADASPKWAPDWQSWPLFGKFWLQALHWSMRSPTDPNLQISSVVEGEQIRLRVEAIDDEGIFQDLLDLRAHIYAGDGTPVETVLSQVRPGRYEAEFTVENPGTYRVEVEQRQGSASAKTETSGFVVPYPAEYRRFGVNQDLLNRITQLSGGQLIAEPAVVFRREAIFEGFEWQPFWHLFLAAAVVLFPFDVAVRRLRLSPNLLRTVVWPYLRNRAAGDVRRTIRFGTAMAIRWLARSLGRGPAHGA
ncbi:MAG: VWA domain-containing protein [Chloroflexi bacterium]|nr:VWA domain-containing protein [Chloroflexota bacterium]